MKTIMKQKYVMMSFILSFLIMTIAFANQGLFPFGDKQIMIIDSWHQYYPILQEFHHKITTGGSLFYSWNTGSGSNFLLMMAYYAMSPINWLSYFFPKEYLREFMLLATLLKISFAGMFFAYYAKSVFKKNDLSITFFGILYAFSGYLMGFYWDIMWLDCVALLPLIVLGMHRLMFQGRFVLFVSTLTIAVISNFYIGYFICEFVALYFFILYFTQFSKQGLKHFAMMIGKFATYSVLAIGLALFTLLPTYLGMKRAYGLSSANPKELSTYETLTDMVNNLLAYVKPTVIDGLPNIYSGIFALVLVILYFCLSNIPIKTKVLNGGLIAFFFISFNINYLNFAWHGFHFPNQVPYRFSFLLSFVLLTLAYEAYVNLHELAPKTIWRVTGLLLLYLLIAEKLYKDLFDFKVFYVSMLLVVLYSSSVLLLKYGKIAQRTFLVLVCYIIIGEALMTALNTTEAAGNSGRNDYPAQNIEVQQALTKLKVSDPDLYRVEMFWNYSVNDPLLYGYKGISQFASTANSVFNVFSRKIGISADPGSNSTIFTPSTPIINGLFSVKYVLSKHNAIIDPNASYEVLFSEKDLSVYKNKFSFPLGFMMEEQVNEWDLEHMSPFTKQEAFMNLATGNTDKLFENVPVTTETYVNMERIKLEDIRYSYKNIDASKIGTAKVAFVAPKTGQMYAYMLNQTKTAVLTVKDKAKIYETPRGVIMDLGIVQQGTPLDLSFEVPAAPTGFFDIQVVMFNEATFESTRHDIIDEPFMVLHHSDTVLSGTVTAAQNGLLYLSIPYEEGWTAYVDGIKTPVVPFKEAVLAVPMLKGDHTLQLNYVPHGFKIGLILSLVSGLILLLMLLKDLLVPVLEKTGLMRRAKND